jgi:predicted amidophosphoribosyltransferase
VQTGPAGRSGRRAALGRSLRAAADLVWPADCAGCGRELAGPLCPACRLALLGPVRRREQAAPRLTVPGGPALPVWSAAWYSDEVRRGIVAWKRQGRGELELEMRRAIARTAEAAGRVLAAVSPRLAVVPVPSRLVKRLSRRVSRRAGGTAVLALAAAEALAGAGLEAAYADVLTRSAASREQAGRSLRERALGREGTTGVSRLPAAPCLLVDDVLTTGATLLDAERALARAGGQTLGAVVLAVSPARSGDIGGPAGRMS